MRPPGAVDQAGDSLHLKGGKPAVERAACDFQLPTSGVDANLTGKANSSHPKPDLVKAWFPRLAGRPTVLSRQEQEARAFLITVPTNPTVRIGGAALSRVWHVGTLSPDVPNLSRKFT